MRLFIAIELPGDLKRMIGRLQADIPGARWVSPEQIHLTLAFLGEVEDSTLESLNMNLALIHQPDFRLYVSGTGCFPDSRRPRVLWMGLEPQPHLETLAAMVRKSVLSCGIQLEERPFSPHITLARLKLSPSREIDVFLEHNMKLNFKPFNVHEFILFQSRMTPQGAVHIPVRPFPLATDDSVGMA